MTRHKNRFARKDVQGIDTFNYFVDLSPCWGADCVEVLFLSSQDEEHDGGGVHVPE